MEHCDIRLAWTHSSLASQLTCVKSMAEIGNFLFEAHQQTLTQYGLYLVHTVCNYQGIFINKLDERQSILEF